ncbi:ATP-binding protein [Candidatus Woesearchaeota archaeon]|nr:ATP-binding protein [Candidatus Woesearchaeota archaeon]
MYDILIGRSDADKEKYGTQGSIFIGKHYVKMGQTVSLSNKVYLDVSKSHVVFIVGKRGSGKSYSMGVIAEGIYDLEDEIKKNLAVVMLDTMGIYWTMKYPNNKEKELLDEWELESKGINVQIFTPIGFYEEYKEKGIPTDFPFSIKTSEINAEEWCMIFNVSVTEPIGILIERIINNLKEEKNEYGIDDIVKAVHADDRTEQSVKDAVENRFLVAEKWGLFSREGTLIEDLVIPGQITILDVSAYATTAGAENLRGLVIGLVAQKLFVQRMVSRRAEEEAAISEEIHFFEEETEKKKEPIVWLIIDEAHEFLPNKGKTPATAPLITVIREGRQPGISLVLASQQPGKIHTDVITQSDIVIAHRITANIDVQSLGGLMQSYMREGLDKQLNLLPSEEGAAIVFDDLNEKLYPIRVRPRFSWHGGSAPTALPKEKKVFEI